jgi:beta-phosphoglucomutase-like phosphatase (HAD superfamily)
MKRLKVTPTTTVALEDSPSGLAAARGAGLRVVAVGHRRPRGDWIGPSEFVPSLAHPARVLELLGLAEPSAD